MSAISLTPLSEEQLEDLYDLWFDLDIWPAGHYFIQHRTLEEIEKGYQEKEFVAFEVKCEDGATLYAVVVLTDEKPHLDIHAAGDEELTAEQGRDTLGAVLQWAATTTELSALHKYLDMDPGPIHEKFQEWGFSPVEDEDALDNGWVLYSIERDAFSRALA